MVCGLQKSVAKEPRSPLASSPRAFPSSPLSRLMSKRKSAIAIAKVSFVSLPQRRRLAPLQKRCWLRLTLCVTLLLCTSAPAL